MSDKMPALISFGPFRLNVTRRLVEREGCAIALGGRAFDILTVLVEQAGTVVSKNDLLARVWSGVTVDEGTLRVQIAALRRALGDGESGSRYITTLSGQGYCFVAPISRSSEPNPAPHHQARERMHNLPNRLMRMLGRERVADEVSKLLTSERFVTVTGPGGIGKTTVAVSIGHDLLAEFEQEVYFFDLGLLTDPALVSTAVASTLGLLVQSEDPTPGLIAFLRDKRALLIFDSCEHVIGTSAALAERICTEARQVHILATSRESLRVEGEHIYRLAPLASPPDDGSLTATQALTFPSVQLFVERAIAGGQRFELSDTDAPIVSQICRRLDGIALAIELAASRTNSYSVSETMALLNDRLELLWEGRRTALPRHQTLSATLDWSYNLLSALERVFLSKLSVFAGMFTIEAALFVAAGEEMTDARCISTIESLISKSLISPRAGDTTCYRLLDTTRAYTAAKLSEFGQVDAVRKRHAIYYSSRLFANSATNSVVPNVSRRAQHLANARAALEWAFSEVGDTPIGITLAVSCIPIFLELSLLTECHRWTQLAVMLLDDTNRGGRCEMELQAALGLSMMFTRGNGDEVRISFLRALELAERAGDLHAQLRLLGQLHIFHERIGDFRTALKFAERSAVLAEDIADPVGIAEAHSALGISYHLEGDNPRAHAHLRAALIQVPASQRIDTFHFGFHYGNRARIALARTLWLEGHPDQAATIARQTIGEAETLAHPVTLCIALIWAVSLSIWNGDLARAEEYLERFTAEADKNSLAPYRAASRGLRGELLLKRGEAESGIVLLQDALQSLHEQRYELLTATFKSSIAEGFLMLGRHTAALDTINETIDSVNGNGDLFMMPELLRIKGLVMIASSEPNLAADALLCSLDLAKQQSALGWQLRTATTLARLRLIHGQDERAHDVLSPVYSGYTEGFDTSDLKAAEDLLSRIAAAKFLSGRHDAVQLGKH